MNENLDIYEFVFDPEIMEGVYGISVVDKPANGVQGFYFNEETEVTSIKLSNEEKRLLTSVVLIPNQKIYRKDIGGNGPGYVYFTEDIIEKLQQNFAKQKSNHNSTINHLDKLEGVYFTESWIVADPEMDKARHLGFKAEDIPVGTWITTMKVDNDELWNDYIKTGVLTGLSIDAMLNTKKIKKEEKIVMNRRQLNDVIQMSIQKVALATGMNEFITKDEVKVYSDELILENVITDADGNPLADGEFVIDGKVYKTDNQGVIIEITDYVAEEIEAADEEVSSEEAPAGEAEVDKDAKIAELETKVTELGKALAEAEAKAVEAEAKLVKAEKDVVEMSLQTPAAKGVKNIPPVLSNEESEKATGILGAFRNVNKKK